MSTSRTSRRRARIAAITIAAALIAGGGPAASAKKMTADKIVDEMIDRDPLGYGGAEARMVMALINSRNQVRKRKVVMYSRKDGDTRRIFLRFLSPADIAGTSFLGIDEDGDRTQYLYMPAMGRTRRISSRQRNASFVGTDYSYADLDNRDIDDAKKKRLADDEVGGQPCYVIAAAPTSDKSRYERIDLWISKKTFLPVRIRFYGKGGEELKRLTVKKVKKIGGRWLIDESKMVDLKREHTTIFKLVDVKLKDDVSLDRFTVRALERG